MGDACNIKSSYMWKQNIGLGNAQWKHKKCRSFLFTFCLLFSILLLPLHPQVCTDILYPKHKQTTSAPADGAELVDKPHGFAQSSSTAWFPKCGPRNLCKFDGTKWKIMDFYITVILHIPHCLKDGWTFYHATLHSLPIQTKFNSVPLGEIG